ncbi:MAG: flagellar hook-associated protein FlgK [Defluviitaleaceae bacterium]|nr:flagellar hook-associated protein FlgK [Defluviitaleaceae bacterium]
MRSAFFPFHVAVSGLHAARANMNVVGHNIANAEIPGFSRQQTVQQAALPLHLRDGRGMYGTGANTTAIIQNRNKFLDMKFWHQRAILGEHTTKTTHLSFVETVFNNLPGAGVLSSFEDFFGRMRDLHGHAPAATFRTNVITGADALAEMVRHNALALQRQQIDINRELADVVTIINSLGSQIASINRQIADFERDGSNANDLRDRRNLLIDELSQYVNVDVIERDFSTSESPNDRRTTVRINGYDFVRHDQFTGLELVPRQSGQRRNEMDVDGLYDLAFSGGQGSFDIYNHALRGVLRGLVDLRDGNNSVTTMPTVAIWPPGFHTNAPDLWTGQWPAPTSTDFPPTVFAATDAERAEAIARFNPNDPATWPVSTQREQFGGVTSNYKGIPFYMNQLNHLVRTFARGINEGLDAQFRQIPGATGHINGFDINGENRSALLFTYTRESDALTATAGVGGNTNRLPLYRTPAGNLVTDNASGLNTRVEDALGVPVYVMDLSGMNALNFTVNPELVHNNSLLATSNHPDQGESNNQVIQGFSLVGTFPHLFREGRLEDFIIAISDHLAIDTNQALNFALSFDEITMQTHNQRLSVKGVDINEEMMDLVRFNAMFQAASKLINVIDTVYDTLINRLGSF